MRIDDQRVGALDAREAVPDRGRSQRGGSVGAVDVEPETVLGTDLGDACQVVEDAEVRRPRGRHDGEQAVAVGRGKRLSQAEPRQPPVGVRPDAEHVDVHDARGRVDRRVGLGGRDHRPPSGRRTVQPRARRVAGGDERREVADRSALDERAARFGRHSRQIGDPAQRGVLGMDGSGAFQPAPGVDRGRIDDEVEQRCRSGRRGGDEREKARMVDRDARGRELVREQGEGGRASDPVLGDRPAGAPVELLGRARTVERRRVELQAVSREVENRPGELLRLVGVLVHGPESTREPSWGSGGLRSVGTRLAVLSGLLVLLLGLAGCGADEDGSAQGPLTVEQALSSSPEEPVTVTGFVVAPEGQPVRLCSALLESYPPQCGEPSLVVEGLDLDAIAG